MKALFLCQKKNGEHFFKSFKITLPFLCIAHTTQAAIEEMVPMYTVQKKAYTTKAGLVAQCFNDIKRFNKTFKILQRKLIALQKRNILKK
jgi:hypothetical protein